MIISQFKRPDLNLRCALVPGTDYYRIWTCQMLPAILRTNISNVFISLMCSNYGTSVAVCIHTRRFAPAYPCLRIFIKAHIQGQWHVRRYLCVCLSHTVNSHSVQSCLRGCTLMNSGSQFYMKLLADHIGNKRSLAWTCTNTRDTA